MSFTTCPMCHGARKGKVVLAEREHSILITVAKKDVVAGPCGWPFLREEAHIFAVKPMTGGSTFLPYYKSVWVPRTIVAKARQMLKA